MSNTNKTSILTIQLIITLTQNKGLPIQAIIDLQTQLLASISAVWFWVQNHALDDTSHIFKKINC